MKGWLALRLSLFGACLLVMASAGPAFAGNGFSHGWRSRYWHEPARHYHYAPELDPNLLGQGLALLGGSILVLSDRRRKR